MSTGSFTKEARYEAERANVPTTLLGLRDLLMENYEKLDAEAPATRRKPPATANPSTYSHRARRRLYPAWVERL